MITVELITPRNAMLFKEVRLRALRDTPLAFGSTYARESALTDQEWIERAAKWSGETGSGYLAMDAVEACGIAAGYIEPDDSSTAHLVSMWVAPPHRRSGVGRQLVHAVDSWARSRGVRTLRLMVTSGNDPARQFYERLGFTLNGRTEPYPNDPAMIEHEMSRACGAIARG
jgi:ribosomal protein S18 acetylase RimI-like enzyme